MQPKIEQTCSPIVQLLFDLFGVLLEEPRGLAPRRGCDHKIPLLPGASLVNIHP